MINLEAKSEELSSLLTGILPLLSQKSSRSGLLRTRPDSRKFY